MNKSVRSTLIATTFIVVVFGFVASPASAQMLGDGNEVFNRDFGPPSCIDSINPEIACFGADVLVTPPTSDPNHTCVAYTNTCSVGCITQEMSALTACSHIADPLGRANCVAIAETTAYACLNQCSVVGTSMCP